MSADLPVSKLILQRFANDADGLDRSCILEQHLRKLLESIETYNGEDPLRPWLQLITWVKNALSADGPNSMLHFSLELCTKTFADDNRYCSDVRFIRTWIRYADCCSLNGQNVFATMETKQIGQYSALFYGAYAVYLEVKKNFSKANEIYWLGMLRQAKPLSLLKEQHSSFLKRMEKRHGRRLMKETDPAISRKETILDPGDSCERDGKASVSISLSSNYKVQRSHPLLELSSNQIYPHDFVASSNCKDIQKVPKPLSPLMELPNNQIDCLDTVLFSSCKDAQKFLEPLKACNKVEKQICADVLVSRVNPWDSDLVNELLGNLNPTLLSYKGFHKYDQKYKGINLSSLKGACHNKILELGSRKYYLKGCTGQGAFAQVFKACEEWDEDMVVVLKIQRPACPWEYYIYSQLDKRIPLEERNNFGYASKMHVYEDCSIMICAYGQHGTLQDVVNSYLATGQRMDELLCVYYTIEMLQILEVLHLAGIIHGDFKPDNLLIRRESKILEDWAPDRSGTWKSQGLCLIDWGRSIDTQLFPPNTEFIADCKTSGFRCVEMQQQRPWTYQADTYGLCCIVHMMLHGNYMEIDLAGKTDKIRPKIPFKRYHKHEIWEEFFSTLLNIKNCKENPPLGPLRRVLEEYLQSSPQLLKRLKTLMVKQSTMMSSTKR